MIQSWAILTTFSSTPPLVTGSKILASPRSNPPLLEGTLDFPESPRSNPPLLDLEVLRRAQRARRRWVFSHVLSNFAVFWQGLEMGSCHGEGSLKLPRKSKVQPPPSWRVPWTCPKVQGPTPPPRGYLGLFEQSKVQVWVGGPFGRGGVVQYDVSIREVYRSGAQPSPLLCVNTMCKEL